MVTHIRRVFQVVSVAKRLFAGRRTAHQLSERPNAAHQLHGDSAVPVVLAAGESPRSKRSQATDGARPCLRRHPHT